MPQSIASGLIVSQHTGARSYKLHTYRNMRSWTFDIVPLAPSHDKGRDNRA